MLCLYLLLGWQACRRACVRPCLFRISIIIIQMKKDPCFRKFTTYFKMPFKINTDTSNISIFEFPLSFANSIEFVEWLYWMGNSIGRNLILKLCYVFQKLNFVSILNEFLNHDHSSDFKVHLSNQQLLLSKHILLTKPKIGGIDPNITY